ncbi:hypothetical protein DFH09DRAFT_1103170 [Mycena vulgaris]|nr:hypothetical protein DFH09DRAFT_1103170 [Mycena vulgaris]
MAEACAAVHQLHSRGQIKFRDLEIARLLLLAAWHSGFFGSSSISLPVLGEDEPLCCSGGADRNERAGPLSIVGSRSVPSIREGPLEDPVWPWEFLLLFVMWRRRSGRIMALERGRFGGW